MRRRTPSEIKAYGDGYTEAYKEFCHLLKNHDVDKAMRKMKIFADAVALTVETATDTADTPQTDCYMCKWMGDRDVCGRCRNRNLFAVADTPQKKDEIVLDPSFAELSDEQFVKAMKLIEPQTDCGWK